MSLPLREVVAVIEHWAPPELGYSFDRHGLQLGAGDQEIRAIAVSLDSSLAAAQFARRKKADLLLVHHPLIWNPLKGLTGHGPRTETIRTLIQANIACYGAHTNWDVAAGGVNDVLAERLGLTEIQRFGSSPEAHQAMIVTTSPATSVPALIEALSAVGAGVIGNYSRCSFFAAGVGTYTPNEAAQPTVGEIGKFNQVDEIRLEMTFPEGRTAAVVAALRASHPYEEPAFQIFSDRKPSTEKVGRIGLLPKPMMAREFRGLVDKVLGTRSDVWVGKDEPIEHVAVVGGAADDEWQAALSAGADAFVTGEVRQSTALEASESGLTIVAAGHYATEMPGMERLAARLESLGLPIFVFTPRPGQSGRPL